MIDKEHMIIEQPKKIKDAFGKLTAKLRGKPKPRWPWNEAKVKPKPAPKPSTWQKVKGFGKKLEDITDEAYKHIKSPEGQKVVKDFAKGVEDVKETAGTFKDVAKYTKWPLIGGISAATVIGAPLSISNKIRQGANIKEQTKYYKRMNQEAEAKESKVPKSEAPKSTPSLNPINKHLPRMFLPLGSGEKSRVTMGIPLG